MEHLTILVKDKSNYNPMIDVMFADISGRKNFLGVVENHCLGKCARLLKKRKIQKYTAGIFNFILAEHYKLYEVLTKNSQNYDVIHILFLNSSFIESRYPASVLKKYKQDFKNLNYILFYIDIVNHPVSWHANDLREQNIFDLTYTVDPADAQKYGFRLWKTPYSMKRRFQQLRTEYDIYFCGVTKGRTSQLLEFIEAGRKHRTDMKMDIMCVDREQYVLKNLGDGITVHVPGTYRPYPELLTSSLKAKCILEIVQKNQKALTLRPYEAVVYNRKLLTNNKTILDFPFYNPMYMQYFESIKDIDWKWIFEDNKIDYRYSGEFSPRLLLSDIYSEMELSH